jgi:hypothetical protein
MPIFFMKPSYVTSIYGYIGNLMQLSESQMNEKLEDRNSLNSIFSSIDKAKEGPGSQ